ncbi:hypothetical protein EW026_g7928 [Hermanssonia centrifuga]|uniref:Uncharacterized protein n=1 Tax=Hermanssonia centrifuga TaxID=98765 RepID=A0A4S4K7Y4_9APHY|nr:hypothetical protein EW026_g7928 [Hermanssonia centrifuga]
MLLLLKPWRNIVTDLKRPEQSWVEAFVEFRNSATTAEGTEHPLPMDDSDYVMGGGDELDGGDAANTDTVISEEAIARVLAQQTSIAELSHAKYAIEVAKGAKIFAAGECIWTPTNDQISNATGGDLAQLLAWQAQMQADVSRLNGVVVPGEIGNAGQEDQGTVQQLQHTSGDGEPSVRPTNVDEVAGVLSATNPAMLKDDQFRAFDIIRWHLNEKVGWQRAASITDDFVRRGWYREI